MKQSKARRITRISVISTAVVLAGLLIPAASASAASPPAGTQTLAQQIVNSGRLSGDAEEVAQIQGYANGTMRSHVVNGQTRNCTIDPAILKALKTVVVDKGFSVSVTSLNRYCTGEVIGQGTTSYHYRDGGGHAIDIGAVNGVQATGNTAQDRALITAMTSALPAPAGLGQLQCHGNMSLPSGWVQFNDTCNHDHFEYRGGPVTVPVDDIDRSFSVTTGGTLQAKASMNAAITTLRQNIVSVAVNGTTTAAVDTSGNVWIQPGDFSNGWVGLMGNAKSASIDGERFAVLKNDGTVVAKDGLYSTTWYTELTGADKVIVANGRLGVLKGGHIYVKEGNLQASWVDQGGGFTDFAMDGNRIGAVSGGTVYVKEGDLYASWVTMRAGSRVGLEGNRVAVLGPDSVLYVKEGDLWASWSSLTAAGVTDFSLSGSRIAVVSGGAYYIKSGALNAAWIGAFANSKLSALS